MIERVSGRAFSVTAIVSALAVAVVCATAPSATHAQELVSLTLDPATIAGGSGSTATGTVTLNAPAPAGGAVVTLTSSNIELAATLPRITVPAGETTARFSVGTNPRYRRYSGLAFSVTISATVGLTRSAVLTVTAQPRPADFTSGSTAGANTQWEGLMCGGIAPIGGQPGILYDCSPPDASGFGTCTFRQECDRGCRRVPPNGSTYSDFCATGGPNPVALSRNAIVSGDRVAATIVAEAPAGQGVDREVGSPGTIDVNHNAIHVPFSSGGIVFPDGATSVPFEVATSYVPAIQFVDVTGFWFNASIPPLLITNGRAGQRWLAMLPPEPAPAVALPTLADFKITGLDPVVGGESTFGNVSLSGISRAGGPTVTLTSSHPDIVPPKTFEAPVSQDTFGFQAVVDTRATATDTDVTLTLSDGRYRFEDVLTVRAAPPPPLLADVAVNPTSVVGGSAATGTVMLSTPQNGPTVVQVSIVETAPATLPSNDAPCPSFSRCHNVTVPAGATSADFTIGTSPVTSQFNLNVFADLPGSPGQQALLLITPGGAITPTALAVNPQSLAGGGTATGTVTLTAAAPSGGAVVSLAKALSNGGAGTVPVTIPASVTVPAGQTSATFSIATDSVTATTTVRISAAYNGVTVNADVTLFTVLGQLSFAPSNVSGGTTTTGTVTLRSPAPAGGASIALASTNPSLVTVPASVTVPAGQTSATFTANTSAVTATTAVDATASYGGVTVSGRMFLTVSSAVSSVTLNPGTVTGGASSTGTVTLRAAPSGNAVVALASSNALLAVVPGTVTVPAGATSATFAVNTASVTATSTVVISATYDNVTQSATLTITAQGSTGGGSVAPGFFTPASHASDSGGDGNGYEVSPANARTADGITATDVNSGTGTSTSCTNSGKDRHRFLDFGITIPDGSAIAGIEVRLDARADSTSGSPRICVQLSSDGGATWTATKATGTLGTSLGTFVLGSTTDAWGRAWTAANLANANFRVRVINVAGSTSRDFFLDGIAVRPHVTTASSPSQTATLTVVATGRTGERVTSAPAGISVAVGSTGAATFATGTSITLTVSNGRDALWSGACSSGGNKSRTCTFTLTANSSVTANVQ